MRITVIDPDDRDFLINTLISVNPWVIVNEAPTRIEGLENRKFKAPRNCTFMDINMVHVNGTERLRIVKSNRMVGDAPVVMLSSTTDHDDKGECLRAGGSIYRVKTHSFEALTKMLQLLGINSMNTSKVSSSGCDQCAELENCEVAY